MLTVDPHPLLDLGAFVTTFPGRLGELTTPPEVVALFDPTTAAPLTSDDEVRTAVRALLRQEGFKPRRRSKPAPESSKQEAQTVVDSPLPRRLRRVWQSPAVNGGLTKNPLGPHALTMKHFAVACDAPAHPVESPAER